jgi:chromosome segregation ATPase
MEAMAKAQQDELLKLRAALDKETLKAQKQSESFQGDLSRMLTRVAEKESELQSAKAEAAAADKEKDKHAAAAAAAATKITTLEGRLATLEASGKAAGKTAEALAAAHARVSVLETTGRALKAEKERCEAALKGFSSANADTVAKMNKEKEQALAELRSDTKVELALLNDKVKAMERDRESAQSKATATEEARVAQEAQLKAHKGEMEAMTAAHTRLEKGAADAAKELATVKAALGERDAELVVLSAAHAELAQTSEVNSVQLATERSKLAESLAQLATCNERVAEMEAKLEEVKVEHKIASRRQKDLIKDLKKSLMKETKRQEISAKKAAAKKKDMAGLRARIEDLEMEIAVAKQAQHREEVEAPMIPARSPGSGGSSVGGGGGGGGGGGASAAAAAAAAALRSPGGGLSGLLKKVQSKIELKTGGGGGGSSVGGGGRGVMAPDARGVQSALAAKLEQLLKENVYVKEKVVMLESIIQDLTNELDAKKTVLASVQSAAATSGDAVNPFAGSTSRTPPRRQRMSTEADAIDEI